MEHGKSHKYSVQYIHPRNISIQLYHLKDRQQTILGQMGLCKNIEIQHQLLISQRRQKKKEKKKNKVGPTSLLIPAAGGKTLIPSCSFFPWDLASQPYDDRGIH